MKIEKKNHNLIFNINIKNLANNYKYLKKISYKSEVAVSVKANSYGLGVLETCSSLIKNNCNSFFVATLEEAIFLRKNFSKINIYVLNGVNELDSYFKILKYKILVIINNKEQLDLAKKFCNLKKRKIQCGIHVDTGMNRLGFNISNFHNNYKNVKKYLDVKLVLSHLSCSEKKKHYLNSEQLKKFELFKKKFFFSDSTLYSLANSNGVFLGKKYHLDMIRSGGFVFGLALSKKTLPKTVLSLYAKIIHIQNVKPGESIGYGATYVTKKKKIIATLAMGYADGLPRHYNGYCIIKKKKAHFLGKISMDLSCIDITNIPNVKVNDFVEIFGENFSVFNFANICKTISYEISTHISTRAEKYYNF